MSEKIGGNNPPFDPAEIVNLDILAAQLRDTYGHLFKEMDTLVSAANTWVLRHQKIENDEEQGVATEKVGQLLDALDGYHGKPGSVHTLAKEPFFKGGRIVDAVLNAELAQPVREVIDNLKKAMKIYAEAKAKRLREIEAAEAKRLADELAAEAKRLAEQGKLEEAMQAEQDAVDIEVAPATISKASQTRGDLGGLSNLRGKWKARIVDEDKVPRVLMMPDLAVIELRMNQSKDKSGTPGTAPPGVEYYLETSLSVRR